MEQKGLPSVITENEFTDDGRLITESGEKKIPAYMAGQRGFSLDENKGPKRRLQESYDRFMNETEIFPLCPFSACGEFLDISELQNLSTIEEEIKFWDEFNENTGRVNYQELMPRSLMIVGIVNGIQMDDGEAGEFGFYAGKIGNPIFAICTDERISLGPTLSYLLGNSNHQKTVFQGDSPTDDFISYFNRYGLGKISQPLVECEEPNIKPLTTDGFIQYEGKKLVPALVLSQAGHDENDRKTLDEFCDDLFSQGVYPLPTFHNSRYDLLNSWRCINGNGEVSPEIIKNVLMKDSAFAISLLDGSHALDDELCAQMGLYCGTQEKPIIGVRSDLRLAENPAATINPAIRYFMDQGPYRGQFIHGANAYSDAIKAAKDLSQEISNDS